MTAFRATFADMKLVKTRQVAQLIFEIPIENFDAAYEVLGGMPVPSKERWFGIAAINIGKGAMPDSAPTVPADRLHNARPQPDNQPARAKRDWRDIPPPQQAGIRCDDAIFTAFLKEGYPEEWRESQDTAACVRLICAVESRGQLIDGPSRVIWHQLDTEFQAWKALEHA